MLIGILLNVVMLSVILVKVVAPSLLLLHAFSPVKIFFSLSRHFPRLCRRYFKRYDDVVVATLEERFTFEVDEAVLPGPE